MWQETKPSTPHGTWTDDALWLAGEFKLDRTSRTEVESSVTLRMAKGDVCIVTEEDVWRYMKGR